VIFRQFVDDDLGCASYLIGDPATGDALVVDPAYAIEPYLDEARRRKVEITRVVETHTHADHVSGHGRFGLEHGAEVHIHPAAEPEFAFEPLADGQELEVGDVVLRVVHTPGHRPEHCALIVTDRSRGDEPWLVLTGDSLLVGDAARPDLAVEAQEGAEGLFHSLRRLAELPDSVEVHPGHVAGSLCGAAVSSKPSSTIGFERRFNRALAVTELDDFLGESLRRATPRPANMERIVGINRGPFMGTPAPLERVESFDGATILDVRPTRDFVGGHVPGAFNVPVTGSSFSTKAGFVLSPDERIVLHASTDDEAERAARGLRAVGFLELAGYVLDPPTPEKLQPIAVEQLDGLLEDGDVEVLDVREADERGRGYIAGTRHMPYRLVRSLSDELKGDRPVVTICESGSRAAIAASVLVASGVDARPVLDGGVSTWHARGGHTVEFRRCGG
jgi:glyoxylase-like metal-dependent hydrolase (beta-lactamase superfamily II)/rhodanese-related sulfurtransferase